MSFAKHCEYECGLFFFTKISHIKVYVYMHNGMYNINLIHVEDSHAKPSELKSFNIHRRFIDPI